MSPAPAGECSGRPWSGRGSRCACRPSSGVRSAGRRHEPSCGAGWSGGTPRSSASRGSSTVPPRVRTRSSSGGRDASTAISSAWSPGTAPRGRWRDSSEPASTSRSTSSRGGGPWFGGPPPFAWSPGSCATPDRRSTSRRGPAGAGAAGHRSWLTSRSSASAPSTPCSRSTPEAPRSTPRRSGWSPGGPPWPASSSSRGSGRFRRAGSPRSIRRRRACILGIAGAPASRDGAAW